MPEVSSRARSKRVIKSFRSQAESQKSAIEKFADLVTTKFGSTEFLIFNSIWFLLWIIFNVRVFPSIEPFDPFPFGLLTMIVSLEAIILSIFVLMSQNRESKIADMREELDLQLNMISEEEITKLLELVAALCEKNGVDLSSDQRLKQMLRPVDTDKIEEVLKKQLN